MTIKTSSAKAKGRNLQKWVCEKLSQLSGVPWGSDDDMKITSRPMSQSGVDVILREEAKELFPFSIECKSGESFQLVKTIEQAKENIKDNTDWLVVHKRKKFRNPIVMMDWYTFEKLLKERIDESKKV